jgi:hypothetical protein
VAGVGTSVPTSVGVDGLGHGGSRAGAGRAAELASEAARAEGASPPSPPTVADGPAAGRGLGQARSRQAAERLTLGHRGRSCTTAPRASRVASKPRGETSHRGRCQDEDRPALVWRCSSSPDGSMAAAFRPKAAKMAHPGAGEPRPGRQVAAGQRHGHGGQDEDGDREHLRPPGEDDRAGLTGAANPDDTSRPSGIYRSSPASSPSGPVPTPWRSP